MKKSIGIIEGRRIKRYYLGKNVLPLTVVRKHLYQTDDRFFHNDRASDESIMFTLLESTQAFGDGELYIDPDDALAVLDTAPSKNGNGSVGFISMFMNNPMMFVYLGIGVVVVFTGLGSLF